MAKKSQIVVVGKRKIELSNLEKILYPKDKLIKAEIIEYYLKIAPSMLSHIKSRPLTMIRFPDGIEGERFFQKNRPDWAPLWIDHVKLGSEVKKDYVMATDQASVIWMANLASLEIHQMHCHKPTFDQPDYFVFDIDPPEGYDFQKVVDIGIRLKEHVEAYGYHTFVKTTGGKGIHILIPLVPSKSFHEVFEVLQKITQAFVESNKDTTLHIKKEARKGRVLIDIYRNRRSQTIVSPYSLRGYPKAPVSMPIHWDELATISDPTIFNCRTVLDLVNNNGDAWEGMKAYAIPLHTERKSILTKKKLGDNPKHKNPQQLKAYSKKRNFDITSEPSPRVVAGNGNAFVIHRHNASRLHYDLRLEQDGTLKSWAIPKGLPPRPGIKRLAVATEDHPLEYLHFEGVIPKGQYGGGDMWIYALGKYEITKEKKNGFYFRLSSPQVDAEYRMHLMKDKEWLLERVDFPQIEWPTEEVKPMLASSSEVPPTSEDYLFEVKWDGIRAIVSIDEGEITLKTRNQKDITAQFPELTVPEKAPRATSAVFDAEIVCFDDNNKPDFKQVIKRMQRSQPGDIERALRKYPAYCYIFDCLYLDGRVLLNEPLIRRREWMKDVVRKESAYRFSEAVDEGEHLFQAAKEHGLEGVMAKEKKSKYSMGRRSKNWIKIKVRQTTDVVIIGYTEGNGDRQPYFGALHIAQFKGKALCYRGKVGTGFSSKEMKAVFKELNAIEKIKRPIKERPLDNAKTIWIEPSLYCEIEYASMTKNETFREPVFLRMRPDF